MQHNAYDFALLNFRKVQLRKSLARVNVVLDGYDAVNLTPDRKESKYITAHEDNENSSSYLGIHPLWTGEFGEVSRLSGLIIWILNGARRFGKFRLFLDQGVTIPRSANQPPFAFCFCGVKILQRNTQWFMCQD